MRRHRIILGIFCLACVPASADQPFRGEPVARAQAPQAAAATPPDPAVGVVYVCPMDPDIRSHQAGTCRRCGMTLVADIPEPVEFHVDVNLIPPAPVPRQPAVLDFHVHDPWKDRPVVDYNVVHERLFHAFVVSEDLTFFEHAHPTFVADGRFQYPIRFPQGGMYRILSDFYPAGATPQLTVQTVFVPGAATAAFPVQLLPDLSEKAGTNMRVALETIPLQPVVGNRTQLRFTIDHVDGLQRYLGAWGHLLAASDDLIDMIHEHPTRTDEGSQVEFEVVFPRPRTYRIWVQFQKQDVVNTVRFDVAAQIAQ